MLKVIIPSYKMRGETAVLECHYRLNGRHPIVIEEVNDAIERVASSRHQGLIINSYHNESDPNRYDNYLFNNRDESHRQQHFHHPDSNGSDEDVDEYDSTDGRDDDDDDLYSHGRHRGGTAEKGSAGGLNGRNNQQHMNSRHNKLHKHHSTSSEQHHHRGSNSGSSADKEEDDEEALYSVKWYRDNEEFYRYVPKDNPPQHSYNVEGIKVDVSGFVVCVLIYIAHSNRFSFFLSKESYFVFAA